MLGDSGKCFCIFEDLAALHVVLHRIVEDEDKVGDCVLQGLVLVPLPRDALQVQRLPDHLVVVGILGP